MSVEDTTHIGNYAVGELLGTGMSGTVLKGTDSETGEDVALKMIDRATLNERQQIQLDREIDAMKAVNHPNILNLKAVDKDCRFTYEGVTKDVVMLVLELASGGELFDFLMYTGAFQENIARSFFHQLLSALDSCHSNHIFHRDIKPENLLLDRDFNLKVADFGLSSVQEEANMTLRTECGTRSYMAPEVMGDSGYEGSKADIWSCGVVLFIMLAGNPPFQIANRQDWWFNACFLKRHDRFWAAHLRTCPQFPPEAQQLLNKIFVADPEDRASIEDIFAEEWMQGPILSPEELAAELQSRKQRVDRQKDRERRAAEAKKRQKMARRGVNRSVFDEDVVAPPLPSRPLSMRTTFYTADDPSHLFATVKNAFSKREAQLVAEDTDKFTLDATLVVPGLEIDVGEEEKVQLPDQPMRVHLNIFHTEEGSHAVEFCREDGDLFAFSALFEDLKNELSDLVVKEDDEDREENSEDDEEFDVEDNEEEEEEELLDTDDVGMI
jgi:serine/threonine protein kinase